MVICSALAAAAVVELLILTYCQGPQPRDAAEAADGELVFSATRALDWHRRILPNEPHPVGSPENDAVRERLTVVLREHGWTVETQTADAATWDDQRVTLTNVLASRPEQVQNTAQPLVLASHYDSCREGPGAGDAGGCVAAIVEAGRVLTRQPDCLQRPLFLLFTDGEEVGLLGARAFVKSHPLSLRLPIVLNLDARGTSGPVMMYETHSGNASAVAAWVQHLARPRFTGSLFTAVYRSMPNGTDFTAFVDGGWIGFNLAIIGSPHRYHQPDDTLQNLAPSSVQHYGEHMLSLASVICADANDVRPATENAVFFDLLGWHVIHFPASWCVPLLSLMLLAALVIYGRPLIRQKAIGATLLVWMTILLIVVTNAAVGWLVSRSLLGTSILPRPFVAHGGWILIGMWLLSQSLSLALAGSIIFRINPDTAWNAVWLAHAIASFAGVILQPEFFGPLAAPGVLALLLTLTVRCPCTRTLLATAGACVLLVPLQHFISQALSPAAGLLLLPTYCLLSLALIPALGRMTHVVTTPVPTASTT